METFNLYIKPKMEKKMLTYSAFSPLKSMVSSFKLLEKLKEPI